MSSRLNTSDGGHCTPILQEAISLFYAEDGRIVFPFLEKKPSGTELLCHKRDRAIRE
jgi:hypothetical protein